MFRGARVAVLAIVAAVAMSSPALGQQYFFALDTADAPGGVCQPLASDRSICSTLRAAVEAANANPSDPEGGDFVFLQVAGTYTVTSPLTLRDGTSVFGRGPRTTTIRGSGASRVVAVPAGQRGLINRVTVAGGRVGPGERGGNILND